MTRRFTQTAWAAATATYLLIILGAIVRITGSGMGCGDHWPLCNGSLLPPLDLPTMIEYGHRLAAVAVSVLVVALAGLGWWETKRVGSGKWSPRVNASYVAVGLLVVQIVLGAITVKLELPAWTVILHLGTAMLLLAALLAAARLTPGARPGTPGPAPTPGLRPGLVAAALGFITVLMGALTANMGAAAACLGFPLCNGTIAPAGDPLQHIHWTHRLLAYALFGYVIWWAARSRARSAWYVVGLVTLQVVVAAAMVLLALPHALQAAHVAVGAAVWAGLVLAVL
jgi:heme A synthase